MNDLENNPYVSRGGLKLASACAKFNINFKNKLVLDIGSSTGGFSDYALKNGANKIFAVELGTNQMASPLREDKRVELHEKTDILDIEPYNSGQAGLKLSFVPNIVVVDLSFVSLRLILPHLSKLVDKKTELVVLVKPQFETGNRDKNKGIVKNEAIRRRVLKDFELWVRDYFVTISKIDSGVTGNKGNKERFYLLKKR